MNTRKAYSRPAISAEDSMEQTALQTCWVTEAFDGNQAGGNFVTGLPCEQFVQKGNAFGTSAECDTVYEGENKFNVNPFS